MALREFLILRVCEEIGSRSRGDTNQFSLSRRKPGSIAPLAHRIKQSQRLTNRGRVRAVQRWAPAFAGEASR